MAKHIKIREQRPATIIKPVISSISTDLKVKLANAFQEIVTKIKEKHLN